MPNLQRRHTSGIAIIQAQSGRPTLFIDGQRVDVWGGQAQLVLLACLLDSLGACPSNRCSNASESDSSLDYEQALSPLEYRSDAASAAECAGLRAQGPRLAVYRWAGAGEPGSQGDHGQLWEWAGPAAVRSAHDGFV